VNHSALNKCVKPLPKIEYMVSGERNKYFFINEQGLSEKGVAGVSPPGGKGVSPLIINNII
jgi:hypothetical protein